MFIPLWLIFLIAIIVVFVGWKIIKFAVKLFIALVLIFLLLMIADMILPYI
jgi:hypothetical protein